MKEFWRKGDKNSNGDHLQHDEIPDCRSVYLVYAKRNSVKGVSFTVRGGWLFGCGKRREEHGRISLNFCVCFLFICYFNPFNLLTGKWVSMETKITTWTIFHSPSVTRLHHKTLFPLSSDSLEKTASFPLKQFCFFMKCEFWRFCGGARDDSLFFWIDAACWVMWLPAFRRDL